jgi:hypothetical protein
MKDLSIKYIFTSPLLNGYSVQTKILNQINFLNKAGARCEGIFFSTEVKEITKIDINTSFYPVKKCEWNYFRKIGQRIIIDKAVYNYLKNAYSNADIFYFRYPGATYGLYRIAKKFGKKIVSEHQSKELEEINSSAKNNVFGIAPSKFLSWLLYNFLPVFNEKLYGKLFVKSILSVVAVTNEIGEYQIKKGAKRSIISANGINVKNYQVRESIDFSYPLKVIFLKGTSTNASWNGLDRLINSIDKMENPHEKIKLIICGYKIEGEIPDKKYIEHLGYKNKSDIDELINNVHVGISTLALHKKQLMEASTLKTREYVSRGLPFIYAYTDPDLNEDSKEFALEFPNDDSLIDMEKVIEFAKKAMEDKELPQKMRKYAEEHLDYEVKMKQLLSELSNL